MAMLKPVTLSQFSRPSRKFGKQLWQEVGGKRFFSRSQWEHRYAKYLQALKDMKIISDWEFEPKIFVFEKIQRGTRSYKPDFRVINHDGSHYWVEVKGYKDAKSKTKIKRFAKYFPEEKLVVVDEEWFRKNS